MYIISGQETFLGLFEQQSQPIQLCLKQYTKQQNIDAADLAICSIQFRYRVVDVGRVVKGIIVLISYSNLNTFQWHRNYYDKAFVYQYCFLFQTITFLGLQKRFFYLVLKILNFFFQFNQIEVAISKVVACTIHVIKNLVYEKCSIKSFETDYGKNQKNKVRRAGQLYEIVIYRKNRSTRSRNITYPGVLYQNHIKYTFITPIILSLCIFRYLGTFMLPKNEYGISRYTVHDRQIELLFVSLRQKFWAIRFRSLLPYNISIILIPSSLSQLNMCLLTYYVEQQSLIVRSAGMIEGCSKMCVVNRCFRDLLLVLVLSQFFGGLRELCTIDAFCIQVHITQEEIVSQTGNVQ
eukprot:TRINITY_DN2813_c2_g1_i1.p1 TRINITY_DN2813_c2_g1~~TRINITY_DN2813_c2_g1_i1.p1  ORF type:complete len:350 (+),score=-15.22 TRINITY_DN2813_c2_g1_i1:785-1834(+)